MRAYLLVAALAATNPLAVSSQSSTDYALANNLAAILAAEKPCNLTYNQDAVAAWIGANVSPGDLDFAPTLQSLTVMATYTIDGMSASAMTAHCAAISQSAAHLGFVE